MKHLLNVSFALALLAGSGAPLLAADKVVSVTFASVVGTEAKDGSKLDPKLFSFGKAVGGDQDQSHSATRGMGRDKLTPCRRALLTSLLKFQAKAKAAGKRVVGVRTFAGKEESADADKCLCLAGGFVVRTIVKAGYK